MSYTILSAVYANADHTSAAAMTEEVGLVVFSETDTPDDWARVLTAGVEIAPFPNEPVAYRLYKSVFISRLTSVEAVTMEAVLAGADAKLRLMFNSVEYFVSDDPLFATLRAAVASVLGEIRADELLAAEPVAT